MTPSGIEPTLNMGPAFFYETRVSIYDTTQHYIIQDPNHEHSRYFPAEYSTSGTYKGDFIYLKKLLKRYFFTKLSGLNRRCHALGS